jgi:hypothetical protein
MGVVAFNTVLHHAGWCPTAYALAMGTALPIFILLAVTLGANLVTVIKLDDMAR